MTSVVVDFYSGGTDDEGRTLEQILAWDDERLERVHDYIQWLFPTRRPSGVNPSAPLVTDDDVGAFARDAALRDGLRAAFDRMLTFYGMRRVGDRIEIDPVRFSSRAPLWLHPGNHNHLRLTRIMESAATLGLIHDARALQRCLLDDVCGGPFGNRVTTRTKVFWQRAHSQHPARDPSR
jgi:hypothetical protein